MIPLTEGQRAGAVKAGPIAINIDFGRTDQSDLHLVAAPLGTPIHNLGIPRIHPEPGLGRTGTVAGWKGRDALPAIDAFAQGEIACFADHACGESGTGVGGSQRADFVFDRLVHVEHAQKAVGAIENPRAAGLAERVGLAPIHLDFLARVAGDGGDFHPHGGLAVGRIPLFDLIGQARPRRSGEADVAAIGCGLVEGEIGGVESDQQWEIRFRGCARQIRPA